ncbi:MAG: hypothetical protein IJE94_07005 [Oscillospiraceae bacterium]|nr:hypothetical protein [Oscillospiraceae bacterium]
MKKTKRLAVCLTALAMLVLLCGCEFRNNVEDLFALPEMPEEFTGLNQRLSELRAEGYEYATPTTGQNLQSVHMVDLDGDRHVEAVAFFRRSDDEKPMKVFVFEAVDDSYELRCSVESSGSSIDTVRYEDLNGDGQRELIVGWKMGADVQTLAVYNLGHEALPLMSCVYSRFTIEDIDQDGYPELFVIRGDSGGVPMVEVYTWQTSILAAVHRSELSSSMAELSRGNIVNGSTAEGHKAVFITGVTEKNMAVTDVLVWQSDFFSGGSVVNAAVDESTGRSSLVLPYRQLRPTDINDDGVTEIPAPESYASSGDTLAAWHHCSAAGHTYVVAHTYHSLSNGWYFMLPQRWWDRVTVFAQETAAGENQVVLSVDGTATLAIYTLTGENREARATMGERFLIRRQTGTVYAAELLEGADMYGMNVELLRSSFSMTENEWLPGNGW